MRGNVVIFVEPLSQEDGGGWLATSPGMPGCMGDGATHEEALIDFQKAALEWEDAVKEQKRQHRQAVRRVKNANR